MSISNEDDQNFAEVRQASNRKGKKAGGWQVLGLDHTVFKGIERKGFKQPTPIQRKTIPCILDGKDVVAMSRTGSGKTAAFVIPLLQKLKRRDAKGARALLVSPTRELALQTFKVTKELGRFTGLRCAVLVGGDNIEDQFSTVHENPDIIIATPGRLLHVIVEMDLRLTHVEYVVFDEADRLFEMGFEQQLIETMKRIPESRQTLLFSATLPKMLVDFAKAGLSDPLLVRLDVDEKISDRLSMVFAACRADEKLSTLVWLCRRADASGEHTVVFCATMKHVEYIVAILHRAGIDVSFLYSQLDSTARKINIEKFREKQTKILVVTDVAARGVDIPLLDTVINLHFPAKAKLFIHRVGRVARAGRSGTAVSLIAPDELPYLCDLFLFLGKPMVFAKNADQYKDSQKLIGKVPATVVSLESDFLATIHDNNEDMKDLCHKATNAMNKYCKTRPPPSAESARRIKDELRVKLSESATHPYLRLDGEAHDSSVLTQLANFRTRSTIFEVHGADKRDAVKIMREKRKMHEGHILETKEKTLDRMRGDTEQPTTVTVEQADDTLLASTFTSMIGSTTGNVISVGGKKKKQSRDEAMRLQKAEHFVPYTASDYQAERQLQVDKVDFARQAAAAAVDICADDESGMSRQKHRKTWDRKLKRYVGASGEEPGAKKIRTEEGTWLPATYKAGRYELWQAKNNTKYQKTEDGPNDEEESGERYEDKNDVRKFNIKRRFGKANQNRDLTDGIRSELKNKDQLLKERRKKESLLNYQKHRRGENLKRKGRGGKSSGSHRRGGPASRTRR